MTIKQAERAYASAYAAKWCAEKALEAATQRLDDAWHELERAHIAIRSE